MVCHSNASDPSEGLEHHAIIAGARPVFQRCSSLAPTDLYQVLQNICDEADLTLIEYRCDILHRCLDPAGIGNLLVSRRCILATREGSPGTRAMSTCIAIGQAAAISAAMAAQHHVDRTNVSANELRATIQSDGALLSAGLSPSLFRWAAIRPGRLWPILRMCELAP